MSFRISVDVPDLGAIIDWESDRVRNYPVSYISGSVSDVYKSILSKDKGKTLPPTNALPGGWGRIPNNNPKFSGWGRTNGVDNR